jgi:predicted O-methyltransferase YrrM
MRITDMDMMLWNIVLTGAVALVSWFARTMWAEQQRLSILLNRTREEIAKEYVTKAEVHHDINRVIDRLERLDEKLDRLVAKENK